MPILLKIFLKIEKEITLLNSFYEVSITLIPKSEKDITRKIKVTISTDIGIKVLNKCLEN